MKMLRRQGGLFSASGCHRVKSIRRYHSRRHADVSLDTNFFGCRYCGGCSRRLNIVVAQRAASKSSVSCPLRSSPSLNFLLSTYQRNGDIPASAETLYESGCLILCEEQNESRLSSGRRGILATLALQHVEVHPGFALTLPSYTCENR